MPAPARIAAWLANIGAPVIPGEPPTTITAFDHLCAFGARGGRHRATSKSSKHPSGTGSAPSGPRSIPMSATCTTPA